MKEMLKIDDFLKNNILTNLKIDSQERYGYYFIEKMDLKSNTYKKSFYKIDLNQNESKELKFDYPISDFDFFEDYLILKSVGDGCTKFYSYHECITGSELVCIIPYEVSEFKFAKDKIYFSATRNKLLDNNVLEATNSPFFNEGHGKARKKEKLIFESDFSGKCISVITPLDMDVDIIDFDMNNHKILFTGKSIDSCKKASSYLFSYDMTTDTMDILIDGGYRIDMVSSFDKNHVLFAGVDLSKYSRNDNQQIYLVDKEKSISTSMEYIDYSNEQTTIISDSYYISAKTNGRCESGFYHIRADRNKQIVCLVERDLSVKYIDTGLKAISSISIKNDNLYIIGLKDLNLTEVYKLSEKTGLVKLTSHNDWTYDYKLSTPVEHTYEIDGTEIDGWIFPPIKTDMHNEIQSNELTDKSPGILMIHGGPKMMYSDVYSFDIQYLCSKGYYVFMCNPSGSDGRGDSFSNIRGCFADKPYKEIMEFTNQILRDHPSIDKERLGVTGGSYGGYMTNHIITSTDRFKTAVSERGISNMVTAITLSDIGNEYVGEYLGITEDPYGNMNVLLANSPIVKINDVNTPTLFNHGEDDRRCSYVESLQMQSALAQNGIDTKLCLYKGENHSLAVKGKPLSKLRRFEEISAWFDKYLKERS